MIAQVKVPVPVGEDGLLPPQAIEAERAILGALLYQPDLLEEVSDLLSPKAFYLDSHRLLYETCVSLLARGIPCDMLQVAMALDAKQLERVGGRAGLASFLDSVVSGAAVDLHCQQVMETWTRRRLGKLGQLMVQLQHEKVPLDALLERAEAELSALMLQESTGGLVPMAEVAAEVYTEVEARLESRELPGYQTGFSQLDVMLNGGLMPGDLIIAAGRPAMGKTAFSLNLANFLAVKTQLTACVFSLEMGRQQLGYRLFSAEASIETGLMKKGLVTAQQMATLAGTVANLADRPIWIDDNPLPSFSYIRSQCRRQKRRHGALGLVMIDYLQLMADGQASGNRAMELGHLTRSLKMLARELDCPVLVLSQLSRGVESRTNKRPLMSDLRESGSIEQDADLIMMLYRDEYYDPETPDKGIAEVIVTKNRNGPTGTVKLLFEPQYQRFSDATFEEY
jgi:replicative DNA helicase